MLQIVIVYSSGTPMSKSVPATFLSTYIAPILNLRFVLIPAGKLLSANRNMNGKNINWEDLSYEEVKALLDWRLNLDFYYLN